MTFRNGEQSIAGAMDAPGEMPSHWLTYFQVESADDVAARAARSGGKIVEAPHDIPDVGRTGLLADPAGAIFGIFQVRPRARSGG